MANESFNWKSLFINTEETTSNRTTQTKVETQSNQFPTDSFPSSSTTNHNQQISNPFINEILDVYEKGFESLNAEGFDFFEMYKSVMSVGATNSQSYQMAFTMGKTINPNLDKPFLLEKAKFYLAELDKVFEKYDATGKAKMSELTKSFVSKKDNLSKEIKNLENQITKLQQELASKSNEYNAIDLNKDGAFFEIQQKMEANNFAKQKLTESIQVVVNGINQYI